MDDESDDEKTAAMPLPDYRASSAISLGAAGLHTQLPTRYFSRDTERPKSEHTYCAVCLGEFEDRQLLCVLPCFHEFRVECMDE
ncbi:RING finger protein 44 [Plakobranchus ocellatus]|uniref:RING finger protein 44 n=1 Tax=Plakobranchus ocellatus TaxID=259542 RepID=A0AAV4AA80_9GAST|nr:RING finger protein 44 [Plakobranchus ocellatus]